MAKDRLITPSYCFILAANFLLYFGFWLLIPVLPFYLSEFFQAGTSIIGIVLSCYTVAALCIRPFSGYLLDTFARKPLYLFAYFIFMMMFGGYLIAGSLTLFIIFRIIHGVSFGMVTVGGNTVVIDIMPSSRRGEGLGYYGLTNNTAMSIGPMFGLFLHDAGVSFATIFCYALGSCVLGFISASLVKTPYKPPVKREPISLDRFILLKGLPAGLSLLLLSIPYGMTTNYVAMYARQIGINTQTGFFFTFMAIGMAISRIFSGKLVDRGKITQIIATGLYLVIFSFFLLASCVYLIQWNEAACTILFFGVALLMGEVGIYLLLIWSFHKKEVIFYAVAISLFFIPAIHIGVSNDFCMRASIPGVFVTMVWCNEQISKLVKTRLKKGLNLRMTALLLALMIGAFTPSVELFRGFYHVVKEKTIFLENMPNETLDVVDGVSYNFETSNASEQLFFKYFAKKLK